MTPDLDMKAARVLILRQAAGVLDYYARTEEYSARHEITCTSDESSMRAIHHQQRMIGFRQAAARVREIAQYIETSGDENRFDLPSQAAAVFEKVRREMEAANG